MTRKVRIAEEVDYESAPPPALERTKTEGSELGGGASGDSAEGGKSIVKSVSQQYRDLRSVPFSEKLVGLEWTPYLTPMPPVDRH